MSKFEQRISFELTPQTAVLFSTLSYLSAQPGGIRDISFHVKELAAKPDTSDAFTPLNSFNVAFGNRGFESAVNGLNLNDPQGIPVEVVSYNDRNHPEVGTGEIVALFGPHPEEHGAFTGIAVTDLGYGPQVVDIAFRSNDPGLTYVIG